MAGIADLSSAASAMDQVTGTVGKVSGTVGKVSSAFSSIKRLIPLAVVGVVGYTIYNKFKSKNEPQAEAVSNENTEQTGQSADGTAANDNQTEAMSQDDLSARLKELDGSNADSSIDEMRAETLVANSDGLSEYINNSNVSKLFTLSLVKESLSDDEIKAASTFVTAVSASCYESEKKCSLFKESDNEPDAYIQSTGKNIRDMLTKYETDKAEAEKDGKLDEAFYKDHADVAFAVGDITPAEYGTYMGYTGADIDTLMTNMDDICKNSVSDLNTFVTKIQNREVDFSKIDTISAFSNEIYGMSFPDGELFPSKEAEGSDRSQDRYDEAMSVLDIITDSAGKEQDGPEAE